ncbi:hypothetical protein PFLUV_G00168670 [Perca fluviatilis]|uniref:Integrase catalytic domain-containing protein n=1 Tax=Perca fluviatilis TaxID=8168 RepID=A0A6A5EYX0_PERFL|nr:hypothetical protein PFLUV_G00168670 [Perca fluviatilis]
MSTDCLINAIRCFVSLRGAVSQLRCDQGTNFVGARNELKEALKQCDTKALEAFLADKQCEFIFNAPSASHAGGVWERQIRTIRNVLNATVAQCPGRLDDSSLRTLFYEAMAIVNSRPLNVEGINDPHSLEPLTPNHLVLMKSKVALPPPGKFVREDLYAAKRWRRVQYLVEQFWSRWKREYLLNVSLRQKWHLPRRNLKVNDLVIIKDDMLARNEWRLGRVIDVTEGSDGLVRRVKQDEYATTEPFSKVDWISFREKMICSILLLIILTSCVSGTFVVNVTQTSYQAEENHHITLEWTFTTLTKHPLNSLNIFCELLTDLRLSVLFHLHEGVEVPESQDEQFAGRVQWDKDVLREGRLRLHVSRLRTNDSGMYLCDVLTS